MIFKCPHCQKENQAPEEAINCKVECFHCKQAFTLTSAAAPASAPKKKVIASGERAKRAVKQQKKSSGSGIAILFLLALLGGGIYFAYDLYQKKIAADLLQQDQDNESAERRRIKKEQEKALIAKKRQEERARKELAESNEGDSEDLDTSDKEAEDRAQEQKDAEEAERQRLADEKAEAEALAEESKKDKAEIEKQRKRLAALNKKQRIKDKRKYKHPDLDFTAWKRTYGKSLSARAWLQNNPKGWHDYYSAKKTECLEESYINLGPLGLRTIMHDKALGDFQAAKELYPQSLISGGKLARNAFQVLYVHKGSPSEKLIKEGDLIIAMDEQRFKTGSEMFTDRVVHAKETRGLEIHAGQLIDAAEAIGKIKLSVLRLPEGKSVKSWKEAQKYVQDIEIKIPRLGSFGQDFDPLSRKLKNYSQTLAYRIAKLQSKQGDWRASGSYARSYFHSSMCGLGLLATGDPKHIRAIRKAAHNIADQATGDWAYPAGIRLLFLSEYYLRTQDRKIIKPLEKAIAESLPFILSDYTAGHKLHPGYNGAGWIGGGAALVAAYSVASKTPAKFDRKIIDKMLNRIEELAPDGQMPYGRDLYGNLKQKRHYDPKDSAKGQAYSAGTGLYALATHITSGPDFFTKIIKKRFGQGPWGDGDGGHATHTLSFVWAVLAANIVSDKAHTGSMESYFWKLTTQRDYNGYINFNTNRLEYHGGEGAIGNPFWQMGSTLLLMNAHKRNLAITGLKKFQSTKNKQNTKSYFMDKAFWNYTLRNWQIVDSVIGKKSPATLKNALKKLSSLKHDENLGPKTFDFLRKYAMTVAKDVKRNKKLKAKQKQYCIEMILGVDHRTSISPPEEKKNGDKNDYGGKPDNYTFHVKTLSPFNTWKLALPDKKRDKNPLPLLKVKGTVTLFDPSKTHLSESKTFSLSDDSKHEYSINLPKGQTFELIAEFKYKIGKIKFHYKRPIIVNSPHPGHRVLNYRKLWVPGKLAKDYIHWSMAVQIAKGRIIDCAEQEAKDITIFTKGKEVPFHQLRSSQKKNPLRKGTKAEFLMSSGHFWEFHIHSVNLEKKSKM